MKFDKQDATLHLTKADVVALATYASSDKTRPQLSSVLVEPSRGRVVSTDGHRLIVATAKDGGHAGEAYLLPAAELAKAAKLVDAKSELVISATRGENGDAVVRIQAGTSTASFAAPDAKMFPPVDQILAMRAAERGNNVADRIGLNAKYLCDILLAQKAAESNGVALDAWGDESNPVWFEARGYDATWVGCIMPMRL
jgi:DNA polymerase III sliding clamp (beta) subunit (PCNA family)